MQLHIVFQVYDSKSGLAPATFSLRKVCSAPFGWRRQHLVSERFCSSRLHRESLFIATFWSCSKSGEKRASAELLSLKIYVKVSATLCIPPSPGFGGRRPGSFWFSRTHLFIASFPADTAHLRFASADTAHLRWPYPFLDFYGSKLMPVLAVKLKALLKEASFVLIFKGNSFIRLCRLKRNKNLN